MKQMPLMPLSQMRLYVARLGTARSGRRIVGSSTSFRRPSAAADNISTFVGCS